MGSGVIKAAAAKVIGRAHVDSGSKCQDAVAVLVGRDSACIAVADGAGSKQRSDVGAQVATQRVARTVLDRFDKLHFLVHTDLQRARNMLLAPVLQALRRKNKRRKEPFESLASTLLFAAYKGGRYVAGHIGDGIIGMKNGGESIVLSAPENGEFLNTTVFVTDRDVAAHLRLYAGIAPDGFGVILMSDGTAESLYRRSSGTLAPAVGKLFDWSRRLPTKKMEDVLRVNLSEIFAMKTTDDCCLALMTVKECVG